MKCCFCGDEIVGYGNSIRPIIRGKNDRCCDKCNLEIIIPYRMAEYISNREYNNNRSRNNIVIS